LAFLRVKKISVNYVGIDKLDHKLFERVGKKDLLKEISSNVLVNPESLKPAIEGDDLYNMI
jgi:hypothetical protein